MKTVFSPHIFIYKPQINSVFSLFLRFILILVFMDFILYCLTFSFFIDVIFSYFIDLLYLTEVILFFYVMANIGEDLLDFDSTDLNYWDLDLITFFNFFFMFCLLFILVSLLFIFLPAIFWSTFIIY